MRFRSGLSRLRFGFPSRGLLMTGFLLHCGFFFFGYRLLFHRNRFGLASHLIVIGFHLGGGFLACKLRHLLHRGGQDYHHDIALFAFLVFVGFRKRLVRHEMAFFHFAPHDEFGFHPVAACPGHILRALRGVARRAVALHE